MEFFISDRKCGFQCESGYHGRNIYCSYEFAISNNYSIFVHFVPITKYSCYASVCLDYIFDDLLLVISKCPDCIKIIQQYCPSIYTTLINSSERKFSGGVLMKCNDLDTGDEKWFLSTYIGNTKLENEDDYKNDYMVSVAISLINLAYHIIEEMQNTTIVLSADNAKIKSMGINNHNLRVLKDAIIGKFGGDLYDIVKKFLLKL